VDFLIRAVANYALYAVGLAAIVVWLRAPRAEKPAFAVAGVVAAALVALGVKVAGTVWSDPRPFVVDHTTPLVRHSVDNGFPSDHTALAATVAAVVLLWHRRAGAALLVVAALLGAARVAAHVHHWPDVLTGFAIGLVCAALGAVVARALAPRFSRAVERRQRTV